MRTSTPLEVTARITTTISAGLVPALWGSPGIGKSDILRSIAAHFNLEVIDLRLSQCESTDLNGIPDRDEGRLVWLPPAVIPLVNDPLPEGRNGWLLFLDEINSAGVDVQKAAYKLILDRAVGTYALHPNVYMAVAGNLGTDRAIVNRMPTPLQSRLVHFNLVPDLDQWLMWAENNNLDNRVLSFIRFSPDSLHRFDPNSQDNTYPCPRTWHMASRLLKNSADIDVTLLSGTVGEGAAVEFAAFIDIFATLPQFSDIIKAPTKTALVDDPGLTHVLCSMLIKKIDGNNADPIVTYVERYAVEYQFYLFQQIRKQRDLAKSTGNTANFTRLSNAMRTPVMLEWMQKYAEKML